MSDNPAFVISLVLVIWSMFVRSDPATAQNLAHGEPAVHLAGCYEIAVDTLGATVHPHLSPNHVPRYVRLSTDLTGWDDELDVPARYRVLVPDPETGELVRKKDTLGWPWVWGLYRPDSLYLGTAGMGPYNVLVATRGSVLSGRVVINTDLLLEDLPVSATFPVTLTRIDCAAVPANMHE